MTTQRMLVSFFSALLLTLTNTTVWAEITGPSHLSFDNVSTEVLEWQWEAENQLGFNSGGVGGGKFEFSDLNVTRLSDHSSSEILKIIATGKHIPTVTFTRGNLTIELEQAFITSYSVNGVNDKKEPTTENFSLSFAKITFQVDGSVFCWDRLNVEQC